MVIYDLVCEHQHRFEGWFRNQEDYTSQQDRKLLSCPHCESRSVQRVPSATWVSNAEQAPAPETPTDPRTVLRQLHQYVEQHFADVGRDFCAEARRIHDGETRQRNIRGRATAEEIERLRESGITVIPLPPKPVDKKKLN